MKNYNDSSWDRTSDLPFVAQYLNHCATAVPYTISVKGKGKSVPLQAWIGPEGSRKFWFPDFMT